MPVSDHAKQAERLVRVDNRTSVHLIVRLRCHPLDVGHRLRWEQQQLNPVPKRAIEDRSLAGDGVRGGLLAVQPQQSASSALRTNAASSRSFRLTVLAASYRIVGAISSGGGPASRRALLKDQT
jgi:hypothetical protein